MVGNPALDATRIRPAVWKWIRLPLSLLQLAFTFIYSEPQFREPVRYTACGIALMPTFVCAVRYPRGGPFRILNLS